MTNGYTRHNYLIDSSTKSVLAVAALSSVLCTVAAIMCFLAVTSFVPHSQLQADRLVVMTFAIWAVAWRLAFGSMVQVIGWLSYYTENLEPAPPPPHKLKWLKGCTVNEKTGRLSTKRRHRPRSDSGVGEAVDKRTIVR